MFGVSLAICLEKTLFTPFLEVDDVLQMPNGVLLRMEECSSVVQRSSRASTHYSFVLEGKLPAKISCPPKYHAPEHPLMLGAAV